MISILKVAAREPARFHKLWTCRKRMVLIRQWKRIPKSRPRGAMMKNIMLVLAVVLGFVIRRGRQGPVTVAADVSLTRNRKKAIISSMGAGGLIWAGIKGKQRDRSSGIHTIDPSQKCPWQTRSFQDGCKAYCRKGLVFWSVMSQRRAALETGDCAVEYTVFGKRSGP